MKIRFFYGAKAGAFSSAIMAAALNAGFVLHVKHPFVSFDVERWEDFLHVVWNACADCSRDSRGQEIVKPLPVSIHYHGKVFSTRVWFDVETKGLRYVSLD